jgi:exonuclease VII large subunit
VKIKKSHLKELVRQSIYDNISEYKEDIKESKRRRFTVKEVQKWMKTLEENRYKKVYNSDCRRVAWMVNNMNEDVTNMPKSMSKKWTKAQYGRERYLAKEFIKSKKQQMAEGKLREVIREILKEQLNEAKFKKVILPNDMKTKLKVSKMIKQMKLKIDKDYDVKALKARGGDQVISILPKHYNKFIELAMQHKLNPRG